MKKGFTLIELLAVIVILAIIALIATPIVLNIIKDAKSSSNERSIELYGKAVEQSVASYQLTHNEQVFGQFTSSDDGKTLTKNSTILTVKYSGNTVKCDVTINKDGTVYMEKCKVGDTDIEYTYGEDESPIKLLSAPETRGQIGAKYSVKVNNEETNNTYNFYVLSKNDDETINLIMDSNICQDGSTGNCTYKWYSSKSNSYGPITAMTVLYEATKSWTNIPVIKLTGYTDAGDQEGLPYTGSYGYTGIEIEDGVATITAKNNASTALIGTVESPMRARLPKTKEVTAAGCNVGQTTSDYGSCPAWLVENLSYANDSSYPNANYVINNGNGKTVYAYWLLSSRSVFSSGVRTVDCYGEVDSPGPVTVGSAGVRPVITVSSSDLQ